MTRQFFPLAIILFLSISSAFARDSPATTYIQKVCEDATDQGLCLKALRRDADRINLHQKKAVRLTIEATIAEVQTTSSKIAHLSEGPKLWTREAKSLEECATSVADSVTSLLDAVHTSEHLGGGNKKGEEDKRLDMESKVKTVKDAADSCMNNLEKLRARDVLVKEVEEALVPLVDLATNAVDLIHHMEF